MFKQIIILSTALLLSQLAHAGQGRNKHHLDLELTSREYLQLMKMMDAKSPKKYQPLTVGNPAYGFGSEDEQLDAWIAIGARNLEWVDYINKNRPADKQLSFSSEATQVGSPVETPRLYNFKIIAEQWRIVTTLLPKALKAVLLENKQLTSQPPVTDREFIEWGLQIDKAYDISARYKYMKPDIAEMTERKMYDVRGYLKLKERANLDEELKNWQSLTEETQNKLRVNLHTICLNNGLESAFCREQLADAIKNNTLVDFKNSYWAQAEETYVSNFRIDESRDDSNWDKASNVLSFPFTNPHNDAIKEFLAYNIEDEFKWDNFQLKLNFVDEAAEDITHVVFEPGVTPHVNKLAGSEITMDANSPLSEYDVQWTIRHEYGHVVGFTDCYVEFYDPEVEAFVSYQLDVTNLMCSRRGKFQQSHYDQLERVYKK